jgi:DNA-binding LacI/PurR family transcriptional regulator
MNSPEIPVAPSSVRLADVAKAAGVSHGTASNAFSRPQIVREELRDRVYEAAKTLGYAGPDPKGRLLRAGKVNAIGVATAEPMAYFFEDPFARELMSGIAEACDAHGAGMALVSAQNDERLAWNIQSALVDGFILLCIEGGSRLVELTQERSLPFIALALSWDDPSISALGIDNYGGARMAARHLVDLGHRNFGVLAIEFDEDRDGPITFEEAEKAVYFTSRDRLRGYFDVLGEAGIETGAVPVYETRSGRASVVAGLDYIFSRADPPTALLAMSDRIALIALEWLAERGLTVPGDVSVVGFDGVPEGRVSKPALTTVTQPIAAMGRRAVEAILDGDGTVLRETLPLAFEIRASTAPPNTDRLTAPGR